MTRLADMPTQYRHGDVLIETIPELPAVREKLPHTILAHGEVTGHCHRIEEAGAADFYSTNQGLCLHVRLAATVIHEEHAPIRLPAGYYRVWRQREYSPEAIRVVRD